MPKDSPLGYAVRAAREAGVPRSAVKSMVEVAKNVSSTPNLNTAIRRLTQQYGGTHAPSMGGRRK